MSEQDELKEMIYEIAKGMKEWKEAGWGEIPNSFYKGHLLWIKHALSSNSIPPNNMYDFIQLLYKPSNMWGIQELDKLFPADATFLIEGFDFSIDIDDFLEEYVSPHEFDQSVMKEILLYCRESELDEEYRQSRSFFSNPENAVLSFYQLRTRLDLFNNQTVKQLMENCYQELPQPVENYKKCPYCGWTLTFFNGRWICNKENLCPYFQSFEYLGGYDFMEGERIYRLRPGIQRYVLLTGMIEEAIYKRLAKYNAVLYPDIDLFDIRITLNDVVIDLDIKDYRSPKMLANSFNNKSDQELKKYHKQSFIVIPNHRLKRIATYKKQFDHHLRSELHSCIQVITERELFKRIKEDALCHTFRLN